MDILDTIGDWFQLFGIAIATFFLIGWITQTITWITNRLFTYTVIGCSLWILVYDYDIILGFILGSTITSIVMIAGLIINKKYGEYEQFNLGIMVLPSHIIILGVMITKIILFW